MSKIPQLQTIPYSLARSSIRIGDIIGCRSSGVFGKGILIFRGGRYQWTHVSIVVRDTLNSIDGHVQVMEAVSPTMDMNYLSAAYERDHGELFLMPMSCTEDQQVRIIAYSAEILRRKPKYDWKNTVLGAVRPLRVGIDKYNCSENNWDVLADCGRVGRVYHKRKPTIELAPAPGNFPVWVAKNDLQEKMNVYKLFMDKKTV